MFGLLEEEVNNFIKSYVTSITAGNLLIFFSENPKPGRDICFLAAVLNQSPEATRAAADDLTRTGLLKFIDSKYYYQPRPELKKPAAAFLKALKNPEKRRLILTKILRSSESCLDLNLNI